MTHPTQLPAVLAVAMASLCMAVSGAAPGGSSAGFRATRLPDGQVLVERNGAPILRYNYATIEPGELLSQISEANRIYARARSDYIHPLYGPSGESLTRDWPVDHPHHRGIYWAWPEVVYGEAMGDLHALQRVFARPTGKVRLDQRSGAAEIRAENRWMWEDKEPIAHEEAVIRVSDAPEGGTFVDLRLTFRALKPGVTLARRGTNAYGGLNLRMAPCTDQRITEHTDPADARPRAAWAEMHGVFEGGKGPVSVVVLQHPGNPEYPGDWVQFPSINWFQPTFPTAGARYPLSQDKPLVLRYRLWVRPGPPVTESEARAVWTRFSRTR